MAVWVLRNVVRWVLKECLVRDESAVSSCQAREVGYLGTVGPMQGGLSPHLCCIIAGVRGPGRRNSVRRGGQRGPRCPFPLKAASCAGPWSRDDGL